MLGRVENYAFTFYTSSLLSVRRHCPVFSPNISFKKITLNHWKPTFECEKKVFRKKIFSRKRFFIYLFFYLRPFQYARPCAQETKPQFPRSFLLDEGPVSLSMPTELCIEFKLLMMIVLSDLKLFSCLIRIKSFKLSKLFSVIWACLK